MSEQVDLRAHPFGRQLKTAHFQKTDGVINHKRRHRRPQRRNKMKIPGGEQTRRKTHFHDRRLRKAPVINNGLAAEQHVEQGQGFSLANVFHLIERRDGLHTRAKERPLRFGQRFAQHCLGQSLAAFVGTVVDPIPLKEARARKRIIGVV